MATAPDSKTVPAVRNGWQARDEPNEAHQEGSIPSSRFDYFLKLRFHNGQSSRTYWFISRIKTSFVLLE
jgi:hypothetical protein